MPQDRTSYTRGYTFTIFLCAPVPRSPDGTMCLQSLSCVASKREIGLPRAAAVFGQNALDVIAVLFFTKYNLLSACWAYCQVKEMYQQLTALLLHA